MTGGRGETRNMRTGLQGRDGASRAVTGPRSAGGALLGRPGRAPVGRRPGAAADEGFCGDSRDGSDSRAVTERFTAVHAI